MTPVESVDSSFVNTRDLTEWDQWSSTFRDRRCLSGVGRLWRYYRMLDRSAWLLTVGVMTMFRPTVSFRLPNVGMHQQLRRAAQEHRMSVSAVVREAVGAWLAEHGTQTRSIVIAHPPSVSEHLQEETL